MVQEDLEMPRESVGNIKSLNNNANFWNENAIPNDVFEKISKLVTYDIQSLNQDDQIDQRELYIEMFKFAHSYNDNAKAMLDWFSLKGSESLWKTTGR